MTFRWMVAASAVGLLGLAAAPWTVSQTAQISALEQQIRQRAGLSLAHHGRSVFAVLPRPHIRIYEPQLRDADGELMVSASSLRVDLGFGGLLTGTLDLARAVLADAIFTVDAARLPAALTTVSARSIDGLGDLEVTHGKIFVRRAGVERPEIAADDIGARLEWSRAGAPLSLTGQARLPAMGEDHAPSRFALWTAQPDRLLGGGASAITLRFEDEGLQVVINGALTLAQAPRFEGQVAASAASLRTAAGWVGVPMPLPGPYRDARLKADAILESGQLGLTNLTISVDGNALDGAASIRFDGQRPSAAATLASASINFTPMFEDYPAAEANGQWARETFPPARLNAADLDLRLSAKRARLGDLQFEDAALSIILKNGRLDLSLAQARAYSGVARARAVVAESEAGLDIRGSLSAEKLDIAPLLWDAAKRQILTGAVGLAASFETSGNCFADLAARLDARGDFSVAAGEIYGLDLDLAFRRMERRPLSVGADLRSGRTPFDGLSAKFNVVQGVADVEEGAARGGAVALFYSGRLNVAERSVDLHVNASRADAEGTALQFGFNIAGAWDEPAVTLDAEGLIRRSDAAAPLLPAPRPAPPN
ncbi:AsmA family protein [Rhodoblastus acidophilus]|nr:AsmA family protein [Rhodoblastus acidophilus]